jgi:hypothetical protein
MVLKKIHGGLMTQQLAQRASGPIDRTSLTRMSLAKMHTKSEYSMHSSLFKELGLEEVNKGVYNGKWSGEGPLVHSYNPATNQIIGSTRTVSHAIRNFFVMNVDLSFLGIEIIVGNGQRTLQNIGAH